MDEFSHIRINEEALAHNLGVFARLSGGMERMSAVVKGAAYGHGLVHISRLLHDMGLRRFCTFTREGAASLRQLLGKENRILVFGPVATQNLESCAKENIELTLSSEGLWQLLKPYRGTLPLRVHLKVDSGMNRMGVPADEAEQWMERIDAHPSLQLTGLYSHLADSANLKDPAFNFEQKARFDRIVKAAGPREIEAHLCNTSGLIALEGCDYSFSRIGIGLYGYWPSADFYDPDLREKYHIPQLKPVLDWSTRVIAVKTLAKGETLGYSRTYQAASDRRIAIVPVGYFDGFPFLLGNRARVLIGDQTVPVIGRVNMNYLSLDVTGVHDVSNGDRVQLLGGDTEDPYSVLDWEKWGGPFVYEALCNLLQKNSGIN